MPGLLASDVVTMLAHVLDDVPVADRRPHERQADALQVAFEPEVRHHCRDDAATCQPALSMPALGNHGHELVAVDDASLLVDDHHAIRIAVETDTDVGPHLAHFVRESFRGRRSALQIDVTAVWLHADSDDV